MTWLAWCAAAWRRWDAFWDSRGADEASWVYELRPQPAVDRPNPLGGRHARPDDFADDPPPAYGKFLARHKKTKPLEVTFREPT